MTTEATPCTCPSDCILDNVPGTLESNLASTQVLLGLAPAVLLLMGSSIAEVAIVSTRRPLLAILIALSCPNSYIVRPFGPVDLREPLRRSETSDREISFGRCLNEPNTSHDSGSEPANGRRKQYRRVRYLWQVGMYVLALAAIGNGADISIYTDLRTISGRRCGALFMPLVWFLKGIVEHGWGMIAARTQLWHVCGHDHSELEDVAASHNIFILKSFSGVLCCMNDAIRFDRLLNSEAYLRISSS